MRTFIRRFPVALLVMLLSAIPLHSQEPTDRLKSRVVAELKRYYHQTFDITVKDSGMVTIDGVVPSFWDRRKVQAIVSRVHGVRKISNWLGVATTPVSDTVIVADIEKQLAHTRAIEHADKIHVTVNKGAVILRGEVCSQREVDIAEEIAAWCPGVQSLVDDLAVSPPKEAISDEHLTETINDLLVRFFPLEKNVQITVKNGVVTLSGSVDKLWAVYEIEHEIQNIQGVRDVTNNLMIDETK